MSKHHHTSYDPSTLSPSVVHIGLGGFARGFVFDFLHDLAARGHKDVGVVAIKPRTAHSPEFDDEKNWPYTLVTGDPSGGKNQHNIRVLRGIIGSKGASQKAVERLADPQTKLVTLTIMPHGYCMDGPNPDMQQLGPDVVAIKDGRLNDIQTGPGLLVAALYQRFMAGQKPPAVLSFDNIPSNGDVLKSVVQTMAGAIKKEFGEYAENLTSPKTAVDRIVPPCPPGQELHACPEIPGQSILTEKARSLFIERDFAPGSLPPFQDVGAHIVDDIRSAEKLKLRMVNGGHLALAVVAKALDIRKVHEAVDESRNPALLRYVDEFIEQAGHAIRPRPSIDLDAHRAKIIERFASNKTDDVDRLLTSTHGKIIPRLFNHSALTREMTADASAFAIGAWMNYLQKRNDNNETYTLRGDDVHAKPVESIWELENLLRPAVTNLDSKVLHRFAKKAVGHYQDMQKRGVRAVLEERFPVVVATEPTPSKTFSVFPVAAPA